MKVLVIGASGYLGGAIYHQLKKQTEDEIYGTCCSSNKSELIQIDVLNKVEIKKLLSLEYDIIIWTIKDLDKEMALSQISLNELIHQISEETRFIYVSTAVGKGRGLDEKAVPHQRMPEEYLSEYMNGKIAGEELVMKHPNHVIVRPGSIYGFDCYGVMDTRMKILFRYFKIGSTYQRTDNMYNSFVHIDDLAASIVELVYNNFRGILNVSGENEVSYYDFNLHLAKLMKIDHRFIVPEYLTEPNYNTLRNDRRKHILETLIREIGCSSEGVGR